MFTIEEMPSLSGFEGGFRGNYGAIPTLKSIDICKGGMSMDKKDRMGNRKTKEQRKQFSVPEEAVLSVLMELDGETATE